MIKNIINSAILLGACNQAEKVSDWKSLYWLFFSPQGREFCKKHNFPNLHVFRQIKTHLAKDINVFIDAGNIENHNYTHVALVGNTTGYLYYDDNTIVHKIILMHGAKAVINASNYAVLLIENIGNCDVKIIDDNTIRIL